MQQRNTSRAKEKRQFISTKRLHDITATGSRQNCSDRNNDPGLRRAPNSPSDVQRTGATCFDWDETWDVDTHLPAVLKCLAGEIAEDVQGLIIALQLQHGFFGGGLHIFLRLQLHYGLNMERSDEAQETALIQRDVQFCGMSSRVRAGGEFQNYAALSAPRPLHVVEP